MDRNSVLELFRKSVTEFGDRVAIDRAGTELTYRELEARSNLLANYLIASGAQKGTAIAILAEDHLAVIASILGILKAGCAFVPLDAAIPEKRLRAMMKLVGPRWIILESKFFTLAENITADLDEDPRFLCLDQCQTSPRKVEYLSLETATADTPAPVPQDEPNDFCYVYFTSGSTGQPKAIAGRLKGIDHFIRWEIKNLNLGPETRVSQLLPFPFDGSLRDIFIPLCCGGTVCVPPSRDTILDAPELIKWLDKQRINVVHCVPSLFRSIVNEAPSPDRLALLRYILMAGEVLLPSDVKRWMDIFGERVQLINLYGTSETTMAKFIHFVQPSDAERRSIPVGKPMPGAAALIVDSRGRPCPPGTIGEIYIRTPFRSLGYYNQPELTKEVFITNPFNNDPNDIVYKTGDLGRVLEDGNFEYLGRLDQQVKIRGQRVELSEVEGLLRKHEWVKEVAVIDREDSSGYKYLCAYVVLDNHDDTAEVRDFCAESLPDYMVPSAFVLMRELPQTISGKVDRRALAGMAQPQIGSDQPFFPPRTQLEEFLCATWAEVLGLSKVGIRSNFFHSGGHSLLATQVVSRLRAALEVEVTLRDLFEAPTVEALAQRIEAALQAGAGSVEGSDFKIKPCPRDVSLPLSFAQQRLWFLDRLEPGSNLYNIPGAISLSGKLDIQALNQTLTEINRRHESLRTVFNTEAGEPVQIIQSPAEVQIPVIDLRDLEPEARTTEVRRRELLAADIPFVLSEGPLLWVELLWLAEDEHVLLFTMHHIISDGWSMGVLVKEVAALYGAYSTGKPSALPELPIQYVDYAAWQREWLEGEKLGRELAYWKEQLAGAPAELKLPADSGRPQNPTYVGESLPVTLSKELSEGLKALSNREGTTLFMTLLAAWQTLLFRYSGQRDIVVGTDIANRNRHETEPLIGFFVNQLVLRGRLSPELSFHELLQQTRELCLGAFAHQDLPFEKLVEELQPDRDMRRAPLFQVKLVLQNAPFKFLRLQGLQLTPLDAPVLIGKAMSPYLMLMLSESAKGLGGVLEYSTDLFERETVKRMIGHFQRLLEEVIADPRRQLGLLPIFSHAQREQLLFAWNQTTTDFPGQTSPAELFEEQVLRSPEARAVFKGEQELTYAELNARANQLAAHLRSLGVGPEVVVAVYLPRSIDLVVTLLAVLKAGGAYLPLGLEWPAARISWVLEDAAASVLVTSEGLESQLPAHWAQVVLVDVEAEQIAQYDSANVPATGAGDNLAYIIYTSGSTGKPKGVMISRRGLVNYLHWSRTAYPFSPEHSAPLHSPLTFDLTVTTLYGPLLAGGSVELLDEGDEVESLRAAWEREQSYDVVKLTPAHLQVLSLLAAHKQSSKGVKALVVGGEQLPAETVERWREFDPEIEIINEYGPTEAVVGCCVYRINGAVAESGAIPIGKPIANVQMYVLDERLEPVAIGVYGEIYIGGEGLARGYVGRPDLTAEKFVPHPHSRLPGARLYRTGDLGRYRADGNLEFLGRVDRQVKVRGYRIELGEIEAELSKYPAVSECVVEVRAGAQDDQRLVAYVVPAAEARFTDTELREYLKQKLPEYMLPSTFVQLDALPLTAHGKVDRSALLLPETERSALVELVRPRTAVEEIVAGVWSEVLGLQQISVQDNFFDLGGHSLLATQVVSRLSTAFNFDLPLRVLFEHPTIASLAQTVVQMRHSGATLPPPLVPIERTGPLPLSFAQQRLWFLDQVDPGFTAYHVPIATRLDGPLHVAALRDAVTEIVRRHEVLRTTFAWVDGAPVQMIHEPQEVPLPITDLSQLGDSERETELWRLVNAEAREPFDLSRGPLLRLQLVRLSEEAHVLLCTMHHIVSDGWSMGVLVGELAALYQAFVSEQSSPLPELPVQYADYAVWQRQWLQGEVLEQQLAYWREQLSGIPTISGLPPDKPRPAIQSYRGAVLLWQLDAELSERLRKLSRDESATLFMTLLAGLAVLLSRHSGERELVIGAPIAGRMQVETEKLIGFFVNTLVLRVDLSGDPSFSELLKRVRETTLGAYTHQEIPFEKLVEELRPERSLGHTPLFQVMLEMRNTDEALPELSGLTLSGLSAAADTAKFDLEFSLADDGRGALAGVVNYSTDLYYAETIENLTHRWQQLLAAVVADPERRISQLELLPEDEHARLDEWNQTDADYPAQDCFHELFEAQVERTPEATAVVFENERINYHELNVRANKVAWALLDKDVGPEALVALLMERTPDFAAAMLGVFKAGAAYLPLDPFHPVRRVQQVLVQSRPRVLLADKKFEPVLLQAMNDWTTGEPPQVLFVEDLLQQELSTENPPSAATPANLAYVIYTSGSTGQPKGAMVEQRGMLNHLYAKVEELTLTAADTVAQTASQSFDISIWQLLAPLLVGGCTHIIAPGITHDPLRLLDEIERGEVSILELVPSLLRATLENMAIVGDSRHLPSLRCLLLTGEALPPDLSRQWLQQYPQIPLLNAYGPTECSDDVTHHRITLPPGDEQFHVAIGRPIGNMRAYILDEQRQPVPIGVKGELYVAGVGVGRGYLNDPVQTAEVFVPDPFGMEAGGRLYRTGDLARYRADGAIEYLGRRDEQVKVRGFRIELTEIEATLNQHQQISESVVVAVSNGSAGSHLVAYFVAPENLETGAPQQFLRERLPDYMIPSTFIRLQQMPLTPNGKIDRRALPAPAPELLERPAVFVAPETEIEKAQAALWAQILKLDQVGVEDNFFELGGHSLGATQLVTRIAASFGVELTLAEFFATPTIRAVSQKIETALLQQTSAAELDQMLSALEEMGDIEVQNLLTLDDARKQSW